MMDKEQMDYLIRHYLHLLPFEEKHTFKYPYLNELEREKEKSRLAEILIEKYPEELFWNNCPKCDKLARTPSAKQCRFCNHDWN